MEVNARTFNVEELVRSACETVSPLVREGVSLHYACDGIGEVHTDEQRVRQMVINLLSNAVKFTEKGEVTVTARREERLVGPQGEGVEAARYKPVPGGDPGPTASMAKPTLVISVSDTGKGIPEEELATVFEEYRQVKGQSESSVQKGTGLGLSITRKFAELLGGSIEVQSEVGKGSSFTVRIPAKYQGHG